MVNIHNIGVTNNKGFIPNSFSQENKIVIASRLLKKIILYSRKIISIYIWRMLKERWDYSRVS